jgi:hypothetical protein
MLGECIPESKARKSNMLNHKLIEAATVFNYLVLD